MGLIIIFTVVYLFLPNGYPYTVGTNDVQNKDETFNSKDIVIINDIQYTFPEILKQLEKMPNPPLIIYRDKTYTIREYLHINVESDIIKLIQNGKNLNSMDLLTIFGGEKIVHITPMIFSTNGRLYTIEELIQTFRPDLNNDIRVTYDNHREEIYYTGMLMSPEEFLNMIFPNTHFDIVMELRLNETDLPDQTKFHIYHNPSVGHDMKLKGGKFFNNFKINLLRMRNSKHLDYFNQKIMRTQNNDNNINIYNYLSQIKEIKYFTIVDEGGTYTVRDFLSSHPNGFKGIIHIYYMNVEVSLDEIPEIISSQPINSQDLYSYLYQLEQNRKVFLKFGNHFYTVKNFLETYPNGFPQDNEIHVYLLNQEINFQDLEQYTHTYVPNENYNNYDSREKIIYGPYNDVIEKEYFYRILWRNKDNPNLYILVSNQRFTISDFLNAYQNYKGNVRVFFGDHEVSLPEFFHMNILFNGNEDLSDISVSDDNLPTELTNQQSNLVQPGQNPIINPYYINDGRNRSPLIYNRPNTFYSRYPQQESYEIPQIQKYPQINKAYQPTFEPNNFYSRYPNHGSYANPLIPKQESYEIPQIQKYPQINKVYQPTFYSGHPNQGSYSNPPIQKSPQINKIYKPTLISSTASNEQHITENISKESPVNQKIFLSPENKKLYSNEKPVQNINKSTSTQKLAIAPQNPTNNNIPIIKMTTITTPQSIKTTQAISDKITGTQRIQPTIERIIPTADLNNMKHPLSEFSISPKQITPESISLSKNIGHAVSSTAIKVINPTLLTTVNTENYPKFKTTNYLPSTKSTPHPNDFGIYFSSEDGSTKPINIHEDSKVEARIKNKNLRNEPVVVSENILPKLIYNGVTYSLQDVLTALAIENSPSVIILHNSVEYSPLEFINKFKNDIPCDLSVYQNGKYIGMDDIFKIVNLNILERRSGNQDQTNLDLKRILLPISRNPSVNILYNNQVYRVEYFLKTRQLPKNFKILIHEVVVKPEDLNKYFNLKTGNVLDNVIDENFPTIYHNGIIYEPYDTLTLLKNNPDNLKIVYNGRYYTPRNFLSIFKINQFPKNFKIVDNANKIIQPNEIIHFINLGNGKTSIDLYFKDKNLRSVKQNKVPMNIMYQGKPYSPKGIVSGYRGRENPINVAFVSGNNRLEPDYGVNYLLDDKEKNDKIKHVLEYADGQKYPETFIYQLLDSLSTDDLLDILRHYKGLNIKALYAKQKLSPEELHMKYRNVPYPNVLEVVFNNMIMPLRDVFKYFDLHTGKPNNSHRYSKISNSEILKLLSDMPYSDLQISYLNKFYRPSELLDKLGSSAENYNIQFTRSGKVLNIDEVIQYIIQNYGMGTYPQQHSGLAYNIQGKVPEVKDTKKVPRIFYKKTVKNSSSQQLYSLEHSPDDHMQMDNVLDSYANQPNYQDDSSDDETIKKYVIQRIMFTNPDNFYLYYKGAKYSPEIFRMVFKNRIPNGVQIFADGKFVNVQEAINKLNYLQSFSKDLLKDDLSSVNDISSISSSIQDTPTNRLFLGTKKLSPDMQNSKIKPNAQTLYLKDLRVPKQDKYFNTRPKYSRNNKNPKKIFYVGQPSELNPGFSGKSPQYDGSYLKPEVFYNKKNMRKYPAKSGNPNFSNEDVIPTYSSGSKSSDELLKQIYYSRIPKYSNNGVKPNKYIKPNFSNGDVIPTYSSESKSSDEILKQIYYSRIPKYSNNGVKPNKYMKPNFSNGDVIPTYSSESKSSDELLKQIYYSRIPKYSNNGVNSNKYMKPKYSNKRKIPMFSKGEMTPLYLDKIPKHSDQFIYPRYYNRYEEPNKMSEEFEQNPIYNNKMPKNSQDSYNLAISNSNTPQNQQVVYFKNGGFYNPTDLLNFLSRYNPYGIKVLHNGKLYNPRQYYKMSRGVVPKGIQFVEKGNVIPVDDVVKIFSLQEYGGENNKFWPNVYFNGKVYTKEDFMKILVALNTDCIKIIFGGVNYTPREFYEKFRARGIPNDFDIQIFGLAPKHRLILELIFDTVFRYTRNNLSDEDTLDIPTIQNYLNTGSSVHNAYYRRHSNKKSLPTNEIAVPHTLKNSNRKQINTGLKKKYIEISEEYPYDDSSEEQDSYPKDSNKMTKQDTSINSENSYYRQESPDIETEHLTKDGGLNFIFDLPRYKLSQFNMLTKEMIKNTMNMK